MNTETTAGEPPLSTILFILVCILLCGFLTLVETALTSSRKSRLQSLAEGGDRKYRKALEGRERSPILVFTIRAWIGFFRVLAGVAGGMGIADFLGLNFGEGSAAYILAMIITALLITLPAIFLGELIPTPLAQAAPERITAALFPCIRVLEILCTPINKIALGFSALIRKLLRLDKNAESTMTEDELRIALMEGEKSGIMESEERTMVEGVFYLGDRPVETFMTHRSEIKWLDINASGEEAKAAAAEFRSQYFFPVADGSLDEVVGLVSARDLLLGLLEKDWPGLKAIMRPPHLVPETMSALKAFEAFKREDTDFLCVMDEYGGFAGSLTVRNLIEEIVGELSGSAGDGDVIQEQEDGSYLADGSVNIDDLAKVLGIEDLLGEHPEYYTLAGFVLNLAGEIPRTGADFEWNRFRFKVVDMDGNRIDKLLIYPPPKDAEAD